MKSIYILRHAKSDWSAAAESDHERPLNKRGRAAAGMMGSFLRTIDQIPHLVLSSTATRARTTAELAAEVGGWNRDIEFESDLYGASPQSILDLVQAIDDSSNRLLIVGHEPTCSSTISKMTGDCRVRFPTAALARVDFGVERWAQIDFGAGALVWLVVPKLLKKLAGTD